jgi:xanthine dehydrogenase accessory factor
MSESDWSVPESTVINAASDLVEASRPAVLATIVHVQGSAYRRPGAKMVVAADGEGVGSITAGCLEEEVIALAREIAETGQARVETYDLTADGDVWGLGVGCNGVIDVLLEPLDAGYRPAIEAFDSGEDLAVCTVLESDHPDLAVGDRSFYDGTDGAFSTTWPDALYRDLRESAVNAAESGDSNALTYDADGDTFSSAWPDRVYDELRDPAARAAENGDSNAIAVGGGSGGSGSGGGSEDGGESVRVFVDGVRTPPELVVFGTGHDIGPLVDLATKNDFRVTVLGFRGATATTERFPGAHDVRSTSPVNVREAYDFDENSYCVVMSHNFVDDRLALDELLETPVPYIGLLGPGKRFEEMREEFAAEGRTFTATERERIYTPIGLDLGGEAPYQIAHSIVAELLAVHNDREPGHLSARKGPIHDRAPLAGAEGDD